MNKLKLGLFDDGSLYTVHDKSPHLITLAPTGKGKGQAHVIPNLWEYGGGVFCVDVKGDNYAKTRKQRQRITPNRVFKFDPMDLDNSATYNPLDFIKRDYLDRWAGCKRLAKMVCVPDRNGYFEDAARDLLTAVFDYLLLLEEAGAIQNPNMQQVCETVARIGLEKGRQEQERSGGSKSTLEMMMSLKGNSPQLHQVASGFEGMADRQFSGVIGTLDSSLSPWRSPRVEAITGKTSKGWIPSKLKENPASIFICVPAESIFEYASILRVMIGQHIEGIMQKLMVRGVEEPFLFLLDEFPLLRYLESIETGLKLGRDYGVRLWMLAQDMGQIKQHWPNPEGILAACDTKAFMNVNDPNTARYVASLIPEQRSPLTGQSKPMLKAQELMLPKWEDKVLVLRDNNMPTILTKRMAYDMERKGQVPN